MRCRIRTVGVSRDDDRRERDRPGDGEIESASGDNRALPKAKDGEKTTERQERHEISVEFEIRAVEHGSDAEYHDQNGRCRDTNRKCMHVPAQASQRTAHQLAAVHPLRAPTAFGPEPRGIAARVDSNNS